MAVANRDLAAASTPALDDDWRFAISYNAILQAANAALNAAGYEVPKGESNHFRAIGSLAFTIGLDVETVDKLDRYRKRRSLTIYDTAGVITTAEVKDIRAIAAQVLKQVNDWLQISHPTLT